MNNTFTYSKGYLVEKADKQEPKEEDFQYMKGYQQFYIDVEEFEDAMNDYDEYKKSLRRFKYDYPDPGKEMELGKDFELSMDWDNNETATIAIPITQRTYSEQDALIERKDLFDKYVKLEEKITTKILDIEDSELMDMWLDWQEKRNILNTDWLKTIESLSLK